MHARVSQEAEGWQERREVSAPSKGMERSATSDQSGGDLSMGIAALLLKAILVIETPLALPPGPMTKPLPIH